MALAGTSALRLPLLRATRPRRPVPFQLILIGVSNVLFPTPGPGSSAFFSHFFCVSCASPCLSCAQHLHTRSARCLPGNRDSHGRARGVHRLGRRRLRCAIREAVIRSGGRRLCDRHKRSARRGMSRAARLAVGEAIEPAAVATLWQPRRFYVNALSYAMHQLLHSDPDPAYL